MKPWGSQPTFRTVFQSVTHRCQSPTSDHSPNRRQSALPAQQRRWLAGVQGAAMSPLVAVRMPRNLGRDARSSTADCRPGPWSPDSVASLQRLGCIRLCELRRCFRAAASSRRRRGTGPITPAQISQYARRPFVTDSLGTNCVLTLRGSPGDRLSFELTRRFPQRTTSAVQESGIWSQENLASPIRYGQRSGDLKVDAPWFATALDSVAS